MIRLTLRDAGPDSPTGLQARACAAAVRAGRCPNCLSELLDVDLLIDVTNEVPAGEVGSVCPSCRDRWRVRWAGRDQGVVSIQREPWRRPEPPHEWLYEL